MTLRILVDSAEYWSALHRDLAAARARVYVQTLSFEADDVGHALAAELLGSRARDRRVLVDAWTDLSLRDRMLYWPANYFDRELRAHARETQRLVDGLCAGGVPVRKTNAVGPLFRGFFSRNHKKLVVVDDVVYTGGINFCHHNFAWHDIMVRMEGADVADFLAADFLATWEARNRARARTFDGTELHVMDGRTNARAFEPLLELFDSARHQIVLHTPYVTFPFLDRVVAAAHRGVEVTLLTPGINNWRFVGSYVLCKARRAGFRVHRYPGMSHVKALIVDDALVLGSCNFDYISYEGHQEVVVVTRAPAVLADFRARVLEPDLAAAPAWDGRVHPVLGATADALMRFSGWAGGGLTRRLPPRRIAAASELHPV